MKYFSFLITLISLSMGTIPQAEAQTCSDFEYPNAKSCEYTMNTGAKLFYTIKTEGDRRYSIYNGNGIEIKSYSRCQNDTLFLYKGESLQYIIKDNDTIGIAYYGVSKIPLKMQVGDSLLSSIDYTTFGYSKTDEQEAPHVSSYIMGDYLITTTSIHKADVNTTFNNGTITINNANAVVVAKEPYTFQGKEYTAYKISCETWVKTILRTSAKSDDRVVNKQAKKNSKKLNKKLEKATQNIGDNEQGYKITPIDMWFVPQLGTFVKMIFYDSQKVLMTYKMELTSIQ